MIRLQVRFSKLLCALLALLWLSGVCGSGVAQASFVPSQFEYRKLIQTEGSTGQYLQTVIDGQTFQHSKNVSLADLRLVQKTGQEVPYYLYAEVGHSEEKSYPVQILNNSYVAGQYSSFVVDFGAGRPTNNHLRLVTPATNFLRRVELAGADDLQAPWHNLKTSDHIFDYRDSRSTDLHYNDNNYRYLQVKIINKAETPLEITGAEAFYQITNQPDEQQLTPQLVSKQDDTVNKSTNLIYDLGYANYPSHRITLAIQDQNFSRKLSLAGSNDQKQWSTTLTEAVIYSYDLEGQIGQQLTVQYPEISSRYLKVMIHNQDNPSLQVKQIRVTSNPRKLVFPYQNGQQYYLYYGSAKAEQPTYDLTQLSGYLNKAAIPIVPLGPEEANSLYQAEQLPWSEENKWVLWGALGLAVLVLGTAIIKTMNKLK